MKEKGDVLKIKTAILSISRLFGIQELTAYRLPLSNAPDACLASMLKHLALGFSYLSGTPMDRVLLKHRFCRRTVKFALRNFEGAFRILFNILSSV